MDSLNYQINEQILVKHALPCLYSSSYSLHSNKLFHRLEFKKTTLNQHQMSTFFLKYYHSINNSFKKCKLYMQQPNVKKLVGLCIAKFQILHLFQLCYIQCHLNLFSMAIIPAHVQAPNK